MRRNLSNLNSGHVEALRRHTRAKAQMQPWRWVPAHDGFHLLDGLNRNRCTVWNNGTWHTWNEHGVGGENDTEQTVGRAKGQAMLAVIRQGWASLVGANVTAAGKKLAQLDSGLQEPTP